MSVLRDIPKSLGLIKRLHDDYLQYFIKCQCNTPVFSITKSPKIKEICVLEICSKQEKSDEKVIDSIKYLQD